MVFPVHVVTQSAEETQRLGAKLGSLFLTQKGRGLPHVLCLSGELGSGKTTFVQGLAKGLEINKRLPSPTFIIVRRYTIPQLSFLFHLDLYRINNEREAASLGFSEMLKVPRAVIVVEWPDRLGALIPHKRIEAWFSALENGKHGITMTNYDH